MATKEQSPAPGCPPDWQEKTLEKKKELLVDGPISGLLLPESWLSSLRPYLQQVTVLLGIKRVGFKGNSITVLPEDD